MKKPIKTSKEHIYKIKYKIVGGKFSKYPPDEVAKLKKRGLL